MLIMNHVTKQFKKRTVLEDVCLEFDRGIYGVLAPNGAGKTTLIKLLVTLITPTTGSISWNGEDIVAMDERYREKLGYLPQRFGYYRSSTPRQFLNYMAALKGMDREIAEIRIASLFDRLGLCGDSDRKMKDCSGGIIQRVGIAQAMLNDPEILILDEPTTGLDPQERVRFRSIIHALSKERIVILSTHIVSDIEQIADQVIFLKNHRILFNESPEAAAEKLKGRVFETTKLEALPEDRLILSDYQREGKPVCRFIASTRPEGAKRVPPTLEDAFMDIYRDTDFRLEGMKKEVR